MKITTYGRVHVSYENGTNGHVRVRGGVVPGGAAFIMLDIEYRDLTEWVVSHIWRAVHDAGHVAIIGPMDAAQALAGDLAWKDGQVPAAPDPTDADDAAAEVEAFNEILADIARFRKENGQ